MQIKGGVLMVYKLSWCFLSFILVWMLIYGTLLTHPCGSYGWSCIEGNCTMIRKCGRFEQWHPIIRYIVNFFATIIVLCYSICMTSIGGPFFTILLVVTGLVRQDERFYNIIYLFYEDIVYLMTFDIDYSQRDVESVIASTMLVIYPLTLYCIITWIRHYYYKSHVPPN